jgi:hypothetical protein
MTLIKKELSTTVTRENGTYVELFMNEDTGTIGYLDSDGVFVAIGGSEYTETIVNISSAQILSIGTTPIELLPAAGVGMYYDWYAFVEYDFGTAPYTNNNLVIDFTDDYINLENMINASENKYAKALTVPYNNMSSEMRTFAYSLNKAITLTSYEGNPTDGNGTLRVKIYHKTITFGA